MKKIFGGCAIAIAATGFFFACSMNEDFSEQETPETKLMMPEEYAEIGKNTMKDWKPLSASSESTTKCRNVPAKPSGNSTKTNASP